MATIARHGMVLATGHLSRDEIFAVVDGALREGVREIVITHPEFPSQSLPVEDQRALAARGALLERCFTTPHTGKIAWEQWLQNIRAAGPEHSVLSTDLGQIFNPPVEDGMALMVDRLLGAGFDRAGGARDGSREHAPGRRSRAAVSAQRLMVIGAHSADFVWRAGGVIAVSAAAGAAASVIALSYGERGESGELWKEPGPDDRERQARTPRRGATSGGRARSRVQLPRSRRLSARDRRATRCGRSPTGSGSSRPTC